MQAGSVGNWPGDDVAVYLVREHRDIRDRISTIDQKLEGIAVALVASRADKGYWEPEWPPGDHHDASNGPSTSTQAMCLVASEGLDTRLTPECRGRIGFNHKGWLVETQQHIAEHIESRKIPSSTYGLNSPVVINWLLRASLVTREQAQNLSEPTLSACLEDPENGKPITREDNNAGSHAFPLLGAVQLAKTLAIPKKQLVSTGRWFEQRIHEQLSYERFNDFKFDAAELTFSVLGALECQQMHWSDVRLRDFLEVIRGAQKRSVYWRPYRPFVATRKGFCLLNLSVEVAAALLRIIQLPRIDGDARKDLKEQWYRDSVVHRLFSENAEALFDYYAWLIAQGKRITDSGNARHGQIGTRDPVGWFSENVQPAASPRMHTWATAQVALFLIEYNRLLAQAARFELLQRSRFSMKEPGQIKTPWAGLEAFDGGRVPVETTDPPLMRGTLGLIERDFIRPRKSGNAARPAKWSFLLYGPPGTSKTAIAESVAVELGWPLITISPSDFLTEGMDQVELRAKKIFDVLQHLSEAVVLFDEIDELVPDRADPEFRKKEGVIKFMTPSMLVKLNDLRRAERIIFVMATNYAERVDAAIRRKGRFDVHFLTTPFDLQGRRQILTKAANTAGATTDIELCAAASVLAVFEELRAIGSGEWALGRTGWLENPQAGPFQPAMASHMKSRLNDLAGTVGDTVLEELLCLIGLLLEIQSPRGFPQWAQNLLELAGNKKSLFLDGFDRIFAERTNLDAPWRARMEAWLRS